MYCLQFSDKMTRNTLKLLELYQYPAVFLIMAMCINSMEKMVSDMCATRESQIACAYYSVILILSIPLYKDNINELKLHSNKLYLVDNMRYMENETEKYTAGIKQMSESFSDVSETIRKLFETSEEVFKNNKMFSIIKQETKNIIEANKQFLTNNL